MAKQDKENKDFKEPVGMVMDNVFLYFMLGLLIIGVGLWLLFRLFILLKK